MLNVFMHEHVLSLHSFNCLSELTNPGAGKHISFLEKGEIISSAGPTPTKSPNGERVTGRNFWGEGAWHTLGRSLELCSLFCV